MVGVFSTCPHAPAHEGEVREMQPRVAAHEWIAAGDLRRWVDVVTAIQVGGSLAGDGSPAMQVYLTIFPKKLPFFEQIQSLGFDTM